MDHARVSSHKHISVVDSQEMWRNYKLVVSEIREARDVDAGILQEQVCS
jgi:hypothetical protein